MFFVFNLSWICDSLFVASKCHSQRTPGLFAVLWVALRVGGFAGGEASWDHPGGLWPVVGLRADDLAAQCDMAGRIQPLVGRGFEGAAVF